MASLQWSDKLALGVDWMDETHVEFVELLGSLEDCADDAMLARVDALLAHTEAHFGRENEQMAAITFPPAHCHVQEHDGVLGIMREVRTMVADGKFEIGRVLARELAPWFENHAGSMDAMLAYVLGALARGEDPFAKAPAMACGHDAATGCGSAEAAACGTEASACATDASACGSADHVHGAACGHADHEHAHDHDHRAAPVAEGTAR